jgi:hypothetical protein
LRESGRRARITTRKHGGPSDSSIPRDARQVHLCRSSNFEDTFSH